jgi:hypothetical protein
VVTGALDTGVAELPPAGVLLLVGLEAVPALVLVSGAESLLLSCLPVKPDWVLPPLLLREFGLACDVLLPLPLFTFCVKPFWTTVPPVEGVWTAGCWV